LNTANEGIRKAIELISYDNFTPEERTQAKNKEAARVTLAKAELYARQERNYEIAKIMLSDNEPEERIAKYTGLTLEQIQELRNEKF
jgi:predicted Zn-dependent peptidase